MNVERRQGIFNKEEEASSSWIRGVNIGGWLLMERFITPYLFAVNSCQLEGELCWYPGQLSAPPIDSPKHKYCDLYQCTPHLIDNVQTNTKDYPTDEYTLAKSFKSKSLAREYFNFHWENFIQKQDVIALKEAGITHVRVPMPHWIMGDIMEDEPWIDGQWLHFVRFANWCREIGLEVWPDIHTAPGSQNGFDNSGQLLPNPTCKHWSDSEENVKRSLKAVDDITKAIVRDGIREVVTGFGVLNEPFLDCDEQVVRKFYDEGLDIVRNNMGRNTSVFIGDIFDAKTFNDGFWIDGDDYNNTFLDSHYYHVFGESARSLSPKQHIAYVCQKNRRDTESCCYSDHPTNQKPSKGISRLVGEWSAAYDTLVVAKLKDVMEGIQKNGVAIEFNRTIPENRQTFLKDFVKAQMVTYEAADVGVSRGWFYWTLKTEGGVFAEWNFLRGIKEKWMPTIPKPKESSESLYGSCRDIVERTVDDQGIVLEFPDPSKVPEESLGWLGDAIDDDYVVSLATSKKDSNKNSKSTSTEKKDVTEEVVSSNKPSTDDSTVHKSGNEGQVAWFPLFVFGFFGYAIYRVFLKNDGRTGISVRGRGQYSSIDTNIDTPTSLSV